MVDVLGGKIALVTGASGGIGGAISQEFAAAGADVALHYYRNQERAIALSSQLRAAYPDRKFPVIQANIAQAEEVDRLFDHVLTIFDTLHILVNNAGINRDRTLKHADLEVWRSVIDVNLVGQALCCRKASWHLGTGGRIINIASIIGFTGNFGQTNYAAAKSGMIGITKSLAQELAQQGVTVNAIAPGFVDTPMTEDMPEAAQIHWKEKTFSKRFALPEEIAWAALFLAAPQASYVTGAVIHVNGGAY